MVVFWLHRRIKENHTKLFRGDVVTRGNYSNSSGKKICTVFATFLYICWLLRERQRRRQRQRGVYVCVWERWMVSRQSLHSFGSGSHPSAPRDTVFLSGARKTLNLASVNARGWSSPAHLQQFQAVDSSFQLLWSYRLRLLLNRAAISQPWQGDLKTVCLWGLGRPPSLTRWCPGELGFPEVTRSASCPFLQQGAHCPSAQIPLSCRHFCHSWWHAYFLPPTHTPPPSAMLVPQEELQQQPQTGNVTEIAKPLWNSCKRPRGRAEVVWETASDPFPRGFVSMAVSQLNTGGTECSPRKQAARITGNLWNRTSPWRRVWGELGKK